MTKTIYDALEAHRQASEKIAESRSGILSTEGEIARLNEILVPLIKQGQSIHQTGFCALKSSCYQRLYHGKQRKNGKVITIVEFRDQ